MSWIKRWIVGRKKIKKLEGINIIQWNSLYKTTRQLKECEDNYYKLKKDYDLLESYYNNLVIKHASLKPEYDILNHEMKVMSDRETW